MENENNAENIQQKPWFSRHKKLTIGLGVIVSIFILLVISFILVFFNSARPSAFSTSLSLSAPSFFEMADVAQENISFDTFDRSTKAGTSVNLTERKIITNASLSLVVLKTEQVLGDIKNIAKTHNGFISSSQVRETGDNKKVGNITIRVPAEEFDDAIDAIKKLAIKVTRENVNARDVTEEFIDMGAQLKNAKATEKQYLTILERADTVEDILNVQKELNRVRGEIERLEGRLTYISRQVDMSTIAVSLVSEADVEIFGVVWSPLQEIKQGIRDMLGGIISFVNILIAFVFRLPSIILWIATLILVLFWTWKGLKLVRRKLNW